MVTVGKMKYNITAIELSMLRRACKHMGLRWEAQAARPAVARRLISQYKRIR